MRVAGTILAWAQLARRRQSRIRRCPYRRGTAKSARIHVGNEHLARRKLVGDVALGAAVVVTGQREHRADAGSRRTWNDHLSQRTCPLDRHVRALRRRNLDRLRTARIFRNGIGMRRRIRARRQHAEMVTDTTCRAPRSTSAIRFSIGFPQRLLPAPVVSTQGTFRSRWPLRAGSNTRPTVSGRHSTSWSPWCRSWPSRDPSRFEFWQLARRHHSSMVSADCRSPISSRSVRLRALR